MQSSGMAGFLSNSLSETMSRVRGASGTEGEPGARPSPNLPRTFEPEAERRFQLRIRALRVPFVRMYCVLFMAIALLYSIANPLLLDNYVANSRLAVLIGLIELVSGLYIGATFWRSYPALPMVDAAALFALACLVGAINVVLFSEILAVEESMRVVCVINRLTISAFAALVLAGRQRLFLLWMAADMAEFLATALTFHQTAIGVSYAALSYVSGGLVMIAINYAIDRSTRVSYALAEALEEERARNEALLHNMLPATAVARIREGQVVADAYAEVSMIFIDMAGFTPLSKRVTPSHLVEVLNGFFNHADKLTTEHGVEKVKTVGDGYLAIALGVDGARNSADAAIAFARAVLANVPELRARTGLDLGLRVGIHSGPVVGGVIGATRMVYDYWGETVNIASRLEGAAPINGIAISESTWLRTTSREGFGPPRQEGLKGLGEICIYTSLPEAGAEVSAAA